ncbi:Carboxypeptidase Y [Mycena venus]|uniref:Carboxypeptidase Y n=1 Tax=Mycena venus TaxID=2733690 RepID=A0A8H6WX61_9AGAR|nr:Carboxypeptidase Y [Mycena venus]
MLSLSLIFSACILGTRAAKSNPYLVAYPSFLNVLPEPFDRPTFLTNLFYQTTLPSNAPPQYGAAYDTLHNASFISFDPRFATDVIGSATGPVEKVAVIEDGSQEMPMYLKDEGVIFWSGNDLTQFRTIDVKTYEVKNYTTSVPVPNAAAGTIHKGQMYLGNFGDTTVHGGIWLLDYKTGNATMILNNQLGLSIGADDMTADDRGGIFFTDTASRVPRTNRTMQSPAALYYLRLSTMSLIAVDPTLIGPNGVVLSPDGKELYVNDNGDTYNPPNNINAQVLTAGKLGSTVYVNSAGPRTIYAYTLSPTTGLPISRRTVAVAEAGFLDGMKVSSSGLIFAAVYGGVDVYDPDGTRLGRINIPDASPNGKPVEKHVVNIVFEGNNLWCFAYGGVYRVQGLLVKGDPRLG